ncbi:MAG: hypothetical protein QOE92_1096 [Chloroflexota bacterium]|nr:hypothetical protein [Chloroflexota bacterium]
MGQVELTVDDDGVVDGGDEGRAAALQVEQAVAQALVVMDHVELGQPRTKHAAQAEAESQRLGEAGGAHQPVFEDVDPIAELAQVGGPEGIVGAVEVEARHPRHGHAGVQLGVRLPGENLDLVAQRREGTGEVAHVHALSAGVRITAVSEQGDTKRSAAGDHGCRRLSAGPVDLSR